MAGVKGAFDLCVEGAKGGGGSSVPPRFFG